MSLSEVESVRAVWAEGRRGEAQRCPEVGSVCLSACHMAGRGCPPPGELPSALKMPVWNAMAWHGSTMRGLGLGVGKAGTGGKKKKTANKQQRRTQVKLVG